jgi:hypothetical protein
MKARGSGEAAGYIERKMREAGPERRGDIRILMNAMTRQTKT